MTPTSRLARCGRSTPALAILLFVPMAGAPAGAQPIVSSVQLASPSGAPDATFFGTDVAVDGPYLLVGDPDESVVGAVHVYERKGALFELFTGLGGAQPGVTPADFGYRVALSGTTAAVLDPGATTPSGQGAVHIFQRGVISPVSSETSRGGLAAWFRVTRIDSTTAGSIFGDVALSGDTLAWGDANTPEKVFVHERNLDGTNAWGLADELTSPHFTGNDGFGLALAVYGDTLIVGAQTHDHNAVPDSGGVFVFRRNEMSGDWQYEAELVLDPPVPNARLGFPVELIRDGSTALPFPLLRAVAGLLPGDSQVSEDVVAFERPEHQTTWGAAELVLDVPNPSFNNLAIAAQDGLVAVADSRSLGQGRAFLVENTGGAWGVRAELSPPAIESNDQFGSAVALDEGSLWVSAVNGGGDDTGVVHEFYTIFADGFESGDTTAW